MSPVSKILRRVALIVALASALHGVRAQRPLGVAYYDADRLYDTLPALFYDDSDFTPAGRLGWTAERYGRKIGQVAAVLDSMRMELVAVAGVETEAVVRDLAAACAEPYCYLHRTLNGFDGLDIALLYHGDRFVPLEAEEGRGWLYVEGDLLPDNSLAPPRRIGLLLCRNGRYAGEALADCRREHPGLPLIAAGRFAPEQAARYGLHDAHLRAERAGRGNIRYRDGWRMRERILVDTALAAPRGGDVYVRRWMVSPRDGTPLPTYDRTAYLGGPGRVLPVFTYTGIP